MSEVNLGQLIADKEARQRRDAIHIAVIEMEAVEMLEPGQAIGVVPNTDGLKASAGCEHVGIVDPLLKHQVSPGERFWMVMNPKTVTDLRHDWNHPAFEKPVTKKGKAKRVQFFF